MQQRPSRRRLLVSCPFFHLLLALFSLLLLHPLVVHAAAEGGRRIVEVYHPFPFTPEGLIRQLQHAQRAVQQGSLAVALTGKDGVVLIGERRDLSPLAVGPTAKIGQLDQHLAYIMSGLVPDGRYLVRRGRTMAQRHWFEYGEEVGLPALLMDLSKVVTSAHYRAPPPSTSDNEKGSNGGGGGGGNAAATGKDFFDEIRSKPSVDPLGDAEAEVRKEGLPARHFGVGFLFAGPEHACEAPSLLKIGTQTEAEAEEAAAASPSSSSYPPWVVYEMGPSGHFVRWSARAIGEGADKAEALLERLYRPDISLEECKKLAVQVCESVLLGGATSTETSSTTAAVASRPQSLEMACLTRDAKGRPHLHRLSDEEMKKLRAHVVETMGVVEASSPTK